MLALVGDYQPDNDPDDGLNCLRGVVWVILVAMAVGGVLFVVGGVMKTVDEIKPNYGPVYACAMYPDLCPVFHRHGYALAVHGSLAKDFDLIAVPWAETVSEPASVLADITDGFAVRLIGGLDVKPHGRLAQTISVGFGECAVDLSFMPSVSTESTV